MRLDEQQRKEYDERGFLFFPGLLAGEEIAVLQRALDQVVKQPRREVVLEKDGKTPRSVFNLQAYDDAFARLVRHPKIVGPVRDLLGEPAYVYQLIVNFKAPFGGDQWPWHQDYPTYHFDDGMQAPKLVNCLIFLDEVTEFNGPLMLIPESHKKTFPLPDLDTTTTSYPGRWASTSLIGDIITSRGISVPKGPPGSVIFAHTNILHASAPNMSPWGRTLASLTLNALSNASASTRRPDYIVPRERTPLEPLDEGCLTALAS
jgi:ectoine hydroxylase